MNKKRNLIIVSLLVLSLILVVSGVTYAFFTYSATGETTNTINVGSIKLQYTELSKKGEGISITDAMPVADNDVAKISSNYFSFKVTGSSDTRMPVSYVVTARMSQNSDEIMGDIVDMYLTDENNNPTPLFTGTIPKYNELEQYTAVSGYTEKIIYTDTVNTDNYEKNFRLRMWVDQGTNLNTSNGTSDYNNKEFSVTVNINAVGSLSTNTDPTPDDDDRERLNILILNDNLDRKTNPTLNKSFNNSTDESGLYVMNTSNGFGGTGNTTYYFRGDVTNNVVEFGKDNYGNPLLWRVLRINEDGTTRLIFDDAINHAAFYRFNNNAEGVEYMYYSNSGDYIKKSVEDWYTENIDKVMSEGSTKKYSDFVASGNYFCEAARVKYEENYTSGLATMLYYENYTPDLNCVTDGNGYGYVNASVGLITYDEVVLAGGYPQQESSAAYYLERRAPGGSLNNDWWTMSPSGFYAELWAAGWIITSTGEPLRNLVDDDYMIRPVINLKADTKAYKDDSTGYYVVD